MNLRGNRSPQPETTKMGCTLSDSEVNDAVKRLANEGAEGLSVVIDDQLQELGGDQTLDYIALNRKVAQSGIIYGLGVLRGPFVKATTTTTWMMDPVSGMPVPQTKTRYKPLFEFLPVWDFYPDMSAKTFNTMDGYFTRVVMSRAQVRKLADRVDFFGDQVKLYLKNNSVGLSRFAPSK